MAHTQRVSGYPPFWGCEAVKPPVTERGSRPMLTSEQITLALAAVAAIVWMVRLEGRLNTTAKEAAALTLDLAKAQAKGEADVAAIRAKADADAVKHSDTRDEVIRLQEQIKHLSALIEKWFEPIDPPAAKRRRSAAQG